MARYAVLNADGIAINVVEWNGFPHQEVDIYEKGVIVEKYTIGWKPPDGCTLRLLEDGDQFDHYNECKVHPDTGKLTSSFKGPDWMSPGYRANLPNAPQNEADPGEGMKVV